MNELPDEINELNSKLDTEDVGQKRYLMNTIFHKAVNHRLDQEELDFEQHETIKELQGVDGYLYKLSQDFLTSSSTFKKQQKLEKILEHVS